MVLLPTTGHGSLQPVPRSIPASSSNCFLSSELRAKDAPESVVRKITGKPRYSREEEKYDGDRQEYEKYDAGNVEEEADVDENMFLGRGRQLYFVTAPQDDTDIADCDSGSGGGAVSSERGPSPCRSRGAGRRDKGKGWFDESLREESAIGKRKLRRLEVSRGEVLEY